MSRSGTTRRFGHMLISASGATLPTSVVDPLRLIFDGVYFISSKKEKKYLQYSTQSITGATANKAASSKQQFSVVFNTSNQRYSITPKGETVDMGVTTNDKDGDHGRVAPTPPDPEWVLTGRDGAFLIGTEEGYVAELSDNNKDVFLKTIDSTREGRQLWIFELVTGTAPEPLIIPGKSYAITNSSTNKRLCVTSTSTLNQVAATTDSVSNAWEMFFNAKGDLFIATTSPGAVVPLSPNYLTNDGVVKAPTISYLIPVVGSSNVYWIMPNPNLNQVLVADKTTDAVSSEAIDTNKPEQKWKIVLQ